MFLTLTWRYEVGPKAQTRNQSREEETTDSLHMSDLQSGDSEGYYLERNWKGNCAMRIMWIEARN
jgi:hypothetical protein